MGFRAERIRRSSLPIRTSDLFCPFMKAPSDLKYQTSFVIYQQYTLTIPTSCLTVVFFMTPSSQRESLPIKLIFIKEHLNESQ